VTKTAVASTNLLYQLKTIRAFRISS